MGRIGYHSIRKCSAADILCARLSYNYEAVRIKSSRARGPGREGDRGQRHPGWGMAAEPAKAPEIVQADILIHSRTRGSRTQPFRAVAGVTRARTMGVITGRVQKPKSIDKIRILL
jgi:hypothetical protein